MMPRKRKPTPLEEANTEIARLRVIIGQLEKDKFHFQTINAHLNTRMEQIIAMKLQEMLITTSVTLGKAGEK